MKGATAELESTINAATRSSTITMGVSHHFLFVFSNQ